MKIKVAEIEILRYQIVAEPYQLIHYPVDYLNVYDDEQLPFLEFKILEDTQKWQLAIKDEFDKRLVTSKNPELSLKIFDELPIMLCEKVVATHVFILNNLDQDDWKDSIIDYIDYVVDTFGKVTDPLMLPLGLNEYLKLLLDTHSIFDWSCYTSDTLEKLAHILNYIAAAYNKDEIEREKFELILEVYDKWFQFFPFDIKLFSKVREKYNETLPILKKKPRFNPYLDIKVYTFYSENEMLSYLISITEKTLESFKSKELIKKRTEYIRNDTKFNLDLQNKQHQFDQNNLLADFSNGSLSYANAIKIWLSTEIKYLKRVLKHYRLNTDFQSFKIQVSEESNKWSFDRLKDFKESLIDQEFIKPIAPSSFKRIFSGEKINKLIVWKSSTINLAYMITELIKIEIVINKKGGESKVKLLEPTPQKHWDITSRCFKKENGLRFLPSNFRNLDPPTEINKSKLDSALKHLYLTVTS